MNSSGYKGRLDREDLNYEAKIRTMFFKHKRIHYFAIDKAIDRMIKHSQETLVGV